MLTFKTITLEKALRGIGKWIITPFFAVGSGVITTVATSTFPFLYSLALPWLIPILATIFLAETAVSIYLFKEAVPETLTGLFVHNIFKDLSAAKKILLGLGLFSALGGGLALGALSYMSGITAIASAATLLSVAVPPVGLAVVALIAVVGFIAYASLLTKWIASAIKNDVHKQVFNYFKEIFTRDQAKPLAQQVLEGFFKLFFTTSILLITVVGTIATLGTLQKGLGAFFSLIPKANLFATQLSSSIITYGLMGVARLPWALQSVCTVFSDLGESLGRTIFRGLYACARVIGVSMQEPVISKKNNDETGMSMAAKIFAVLVHGFSFGAIAKSGGGAVLSQTMTKMNIPLSPAIIEKTGQIASLTSGGSMAMGLSAFAFFYRKKQLPPSKFDSEDPELEGPKKKI